MIDQFNIQEGNPTILRYQVVEADGDYTVQADVASMKYYVYETETETEKTPAGGVTLTVSDCVFNTLQTWDKDDTGYNVRVAVSSSYLTDANKTYRVEVKITPATGEAYYLNHVELRTIETYST